MSLKSTTSQTLRKRPREDSPHDIESSSKRVQKIQSGKFEGSTNAPPALRLTEASDSSERATDTGHTLDAKALRSSILEQLKKKGYRIGLRTDTSAQGEGDTAVDNAFAKFAEEEVKISGKAREHLVRPSGRLGAPLGIQLHYPTFSGKQLDDGEVANETFACIRMLLRKGLSTTETFWFESWFRRKTAPPTTSNPRATPMDHYPKALHACHASFVDWCEEEASFAVVLLAGEPVTKSFRKRYEQKKVMLVVEDTSIDLHVVVNEGLIIHVGIPAPHPHYFLMAITGRVPRPYSVAKQLDTAINVAVALSNARLMTDETYFQRLLAHRYIGPATQTFNANPRLAMIEGLQYEQRTETKKAFSELPAVILDWLKKELDTQDLERIESVVTSPTTSCLQVVQQMMTRKGNENRTLGLDKKRAASELDFERTAIRRNETPLETHCEVCKAHVVIDDAPLFGTEEPVLGVYIARITKACKSGCCNKRKDGTSGKTPRSIDLVPVDASVKFIRQLAWRKLCDEQKIAGSK